MKTRGAILFDAPGEYQAVDIDLDEPREGEIMVQLAASGLCHSDDHCATGDMRFGIYPVCGGHEGAGTVVAVGPDTRGFDIGDHVIFPFLPSCGRCRWCSTGHQNLCDMGAFLGKGSRFGDETSFRMRLSDGTSIGQMNGISTFAEHTTVHVESALKIDKDLPLEHMSLLGCCVGTGWGSAVNAGEVRPGHTVIVMGIGGVGINAVQGAAMVGASHVIAVDPIEFKRVSALELGATHAVADIEEAADIARSLTNGQGADSAVVTVGVTRGEHVGAAIRAIRKGGTVVVTGVGPEESIPVVMWQLSMFQKRIQGVVYGVCNPRWDILNQIELYRTGQLKLAEIITTRYALDDIAQGYRDMHAGKNLRGVIVYDQ